MATNLTEQPRGVASTSVRLVIKSGPLVLGLVLAIVIAGPLLAGGWPLLLDYVPGPHSSKIPLTFWGLGGGVTASLPVTFAIDGLDLVLPNRFVASFAIGIIFPLATTSVAKLIRGSRVAQLSGALIYCVNPIIFDRLWVGHVGFLLGYALLPRFVDGLRTSEGKLRELVAPILWLTLMVGCSVHFLWIGGIVLAAYLLAKRLSVRRCVQSLLLVVLVAGSSAYLSPGAGTDATAAAGVTTQDLSAFATVAQPHIGVLGAVATLQGFWRVDPGQPVRTIVVWPLVFGAILLLVGAGVAAAVRTVERRQTTVALGASALVGLFFACGTAGPTGAAFRWCFLHVPGFAIMREPQKFAVLLALFYSYAFGLGVERMVESSRSLLKQAVALSIAAVIVVAYTPTLFWGFGGKIEATSYPASWTAAQKLMTGDGNVLFLPWHQYMDVRFAQNRRIANASGSFFRQNVVSGDNVELPGLPTSSTSTTSAYLQYLYSVGPRIYAFGRLVAPLGIQYVVVDHSVDWQSSSWLNDQSDLRRISSTADIDVYLNLAYAGDSAPISAVHQYANWSELVEAVSSSGASAFDATVKSPSGAAIDNQPDPGPPPAPLISEIRISHVSYSLRSVTTPYVELAEPYDAGWAVKSTKPEVSATGTMIVQLPEGAKSVSFITWRDQKIRYLVSLIVFSFVVTVRPLHMCVRSRLKQPNTRLGTPTTAA